MTLVHFDLELHQMDVKTVFLNGDIDETIYMVQPENCLETQRICLQIKELHLWTQASFPSMVLQISSSSCLIWFRDKCC